MRSCLCYEVSERDGEQKTMEAQAAAERQKIEADAKAAVVKIAPWPKVKITRQPQWKKAVTPGTPVTLSVKALNAETYQWYYRPGGTEYWYKCDFAAATGAKTRRYNLLLAIGRFINFTIFFCSSSRSVFITGSTSAMAAGRSRPMNLCPAFVYLKAFGR